MMDFLEYEKRRSNTIQLKIMLTFVLFIAVVALAVI